MVMLEDQAMRRTHIPLRADRPAKGEQPEHVKVVYVTHFVPSDVGGGGHHRSYQILYDLQQVVGPQNVRTISFREWKERCPAPTPGNAMTRFRERVQFAIKYRLENPFRLVRKTTFSPRAYSDPEFLSFYESIIHQQALPQVCVIEHPGFAGITAVNARHGIATFICPQNLESLDTARVLDDFWYRRALLYDLANELQGYSACQERLFISQAETAIVSGFGLPSRYYPYRPVGAIEKRCYAIRARRESQEQEPGLFLLLGSAGHRTTGEGFRWFIDQGKEHGLPEGIRIVLAGAKTDRILSVGETVLGIDVMGWVEQPVLDHLLIKAEAVLVPQHRGFGALTRLSELACAGVPVIASRHVTYPMSVPPGVRVVDDTWNAWVKAIQTVPGDPPATVEEYRHWHNSQPSTLESLLTKRLELSSTRN